MTAILAVMTTGRGGACNAYSSAASLLLKLCTFESRPVGLTAGRCLAHALYSAFGVGYFEKVLLTRWMRICTLNANHNKIWIGVLGQLLLTRVGVVVVAWPI